MPILEKGAEIGSYRLERLLGKGGMGEVWLAFDPAMERHVAIKILSAQFSEEGEFLERFRREVKLAGQLQHKHVITAYEAGIIDETPYLVMQYIQGRELEDMILASGPIPEKKALKIALQIADALQYAWTNFKILHRDIKPSNIMVDEEGHAYLMDMGVSKSADENAHITMTGMVVGTPNYMSPEQARGIPLDFRADAYSLGATLHHMLTGTPPFEDENTVQVLTRVITEELPDLHDVDPNISPGCRALVQRMTAKSPKDRYADWDTLKQDIVRVLKGKTLGRQRDAHNPYASADVKGTGDTQSDLEPSEGEPSAMPLILTLILITLIIVLGAAIFTVSWKSKTPQPTATAPEN